VKDPFTPSKLSPRDDLEKNKGKSKMRGEEARKANLASRSERLILTISLIFDATIIWVHLISYNSN
jgi:hypothetical protein